MADALSRSPVDEPEQQAGDQVATLEDFKPCSWYRTKKEAVEKNPEAFPDYCIKEGRLYRHFWDMTDQKEDELADSWKLCVPKDGRKSVLEENSHSRPTAANQKIAKTIARVARSYHWPGMFRDIARFVRNCTVCRRYKSQTTETARKDATVPKLHPVGNR